MIITERKYYFKGCTLIETGNGKTWQTIVTSSKHNFTGANQDTNASLTNQYEENLR